MTKNKTGDFNMEKIIKLTEEMLEAIESGKDFPKNSEKNLRSSQRIDICFFVIIMSVDRWSQTND